MPRHLTELDFEAGGLLDGLGGVAAFMATQTTFNENTTYTFSGYEVHFATIDATLAPMAGNVNQDVKVGAAPSFQAAYFTGTGTGGFIRLIDDDGSDYLVIKNVASMTSNRELSLDIGNAPRTLTMTGSATLNQDVSTAGAPIFGGWLYGDPWTAGGDVDTLLAATTTSGTQVRAAANGHLVLSLRENGSDDCFAVLSGGGNWNSDTTLDKILIRINAGGEVFVPGTNALTTASAANVNVSATGSLRKSTSSIRYKKDIEPIDKDHLYKVLELEPIWFRSLSDADNPAWSFYGFSAEQVAKVDPRLVFWKTEEDKVEVIPEFDEDGEFVKNTLKRTITQLETPIAEGVQYDRIVPHLVGIIKDLQERIEALERGVPAP